MAMSKVIKEFREYLTKKDSNSVNDNGIRVGDSIKELDILYKQAVIKERKANLEKDFINEPERT